MNARMNECANARMREREMRFPTRINQCDRSRIVHRREIAPSFLPFLPSFPPSFEQSHQSPNRRSTHRERARGTHTLTDHDSWKKVHDATLPRRASSSSHDRSMCVSLALSVFPRVMIGQCVCPSLCVSTRARWRTTDETRRDWVGGAV